MATPDTVFGVEVARAATIRYLNLGLSPGPQPRAVRIAGGDAQAGLFTVCRHCGGVLGIRGDGRDSSDPAHHRTWCKVRSGARKENWDSLALVHELRTEAVRILLPIAEFEYVERMASFKAALMLGLRDSFGGDPSHLRVIESDFPGSRRRTPTSATASSSCTTPFRAEPATCRASQTPTSCGGSSPAPVT